MGELTQLRLATGNLKASLPALMAHAARMSDYEIDRDFMECLVPVAETPEAAETLIAYGNARRKALYFGPGRKGANNHEQVKATGLHKPKRTRRTA